ncbi:uncharacterized protein [Heptranchias perlo]|uniref:uncharacterized protein n=1 Tax=Heptranchias perlo TaxID=212740 RepID=UPI00355A8EB0
MGHSEICCILLLIFNLQLVTSCGSEEYNFQELCCPMCHSGTRVLKHCTSASSTTCVPCARGTFTDHPNGFEKCLKCKYCDPELGLETLKECNDTQNASCDCKDGYFCLARTKDGCHMCTKFIPHIFNENTKAKGNHRQHEVRPTSESGITHGDTIIKFMGQDEAQNPSPLGNKTQRRKTISKPEISDTFSKGESASETIPGKLKFGHRQDPVTITKTLTALMQEIDQAFPKESLKLQEAGNTATTKLQNTVQTNLTNIQSVLQTGLADIRITIQTGMAGLQSAMKTGMTDIKNALQIGMTGIQEAIKSGIADIKGITQVDNTLKQQQANSQSNMIQMTKQIGSLVTLLTKLASNQTVSFIQLKDITCKPSIKTEVVQLQGTEKQP